MGNESIRGSSPKETSRSLFISMIPPVINSSHLTQSTGQVSDGQVICSIVLNFPKHWLIVDISIEDIELSIVTALSEL